MCDGVVPTDSSWSMSGHQESVDVHFDAHSQHVVLDLVSWSGPFRHTLLHRREGPIILTYGPTLRPLLFGVDPQSVLGQVRNAHRFSVSDGNSDRRSVRPSGRAYGTIYRRSGDPRFRRQRCTVRPDRARPYRGAARTRAGLPGTGSPIHAGPSGPSGSGLL